MRRKNPMALGGEAEVDVVAERMRGRGVEDGCRDYGDEQSPLL